MSLTHAARRRLLDIARRRSDEDLRLLEGEKAVRDALEGGAVRELFLAADLPEQRAADLAARATQAGVPVGTLSGKDVERLGRTVSPQGVLALVAPRSDTLADVLAASGPAIWLDGVQDPGNVGAIVRVATAFGFGGLLVGRGSADPLGLKALRASAGLALSLPQVTAPAEDIAEAVAATSRPVIALAADGQPLSQVTPPRDDAVLVVGAEGPGLSSAAKAAATLTVGIPLAPGVDSLNASVAAGIVAFWLVQARA